MPEDWQPGDVVRLSTGHVCGLIAGDVLNPWVCLNDTDDDGSGLFWEQDEIDACRPVLLVRDGQPVVPGVSAG
jgi:hypothetical protein